MEININNAFPLAVQISLAPCAPAYISFRNKLHEIVYRSINILLKKPFFTTTLFIFSLMLLTVLMTYFCIVFIGSLCLVVFILVLEGLAAIFFMLNISIAITFTLLLSTIMLKINYYSMLQLQDTNM